MAGICAQTIIVVVAEVVRSRWVVRGTDPGGVLLCTFTGTVLRSPLPGLASGAVALRDLIQGDRGAGFRQPLGSVTADPAVP